MALAELREVLQADDTKQWPYDTKYLVTSFYQTLELGLDIIRLSLIAKLFNI